MTKRSSDSAEVPLHGGVANAGAVTRQGEHVLRPSNAHTASIHAFLGTLADAGFDGASQPVGIDPDGRERLVYIDGDVPIPPYPSWARTDEALASVAVLLRRFHDAAARVGVPTGSGWSTEMVDLDRAGHDGLVVCHNDVCLENVVFRDGIAVALLDFDFAAPGRPLYDLSQFARMCVPIDDEVNAGKLGWEPHDVFARLRVVADAYGLPPDRSEFLHILASGIRRGGQFNLRKVEEGDPNFIKMWNELGGMERFDRRRRWFAANRDHFATALG
jgi:phosphotransferase family enzyme